MASNEQPLPSAPAEPEPPAPIDAPVVYTDMPATFTEFLWEVLLGSPKSDTQSQPEASVDQPTTAATTDPQPPGSLFTTLTSWTSTLAQVALHPLLSPSSPTATTNTPEPALNTRTRTPSPPRPATRLSDLPPVRLEGRESKLVQDPVLTRAWAERIRPHLPRRYRYAERWQLIFSLEQHGISMSTLYQRMQMYTDEYCSGPQSCPTLLLLKTSTNAILGAFVTEQWRQNSGSGTVKVKSASPSIGSSLMMMAAGERSFYGSPESFLFRFLGHNVVETHPATQKNDYYQLSEADFLAMGSGGESKFSFYLDGDLYQGYTSGTPTFTNAGPLTPSADFECIALEIWGILTE